MKLTLAVFLTLAVGSFASFTGDMVNSQHSMMPGLQQRRTFRVTLKAATNPNSVLRGHVHLVADTHLVALYASEVERLRVHHDVTSVNEVPPSKKVARSGALSGPSIFHALFLPAQDFPANSPPVEWDRRVRRSQVPGLELVGTANHKSVLQCKSCDAEDALRWITEQPDVFWVEPRPEEHFRIKNAFSRGVSQGGSVGLTPVWDAGIKGEGQVVGVSDTGIDFDNCFYWDHNTGQKPFKWDEIDHDRRKVILYLTKFGDDGDYKHGHGTHVTGSVAGNALDLQGLPTGPKNYDGMAPKAKLAFTDIAKGDGALNIPKALDGGEDGGLFPLPYKAGARIHSNSWGSGFGGYSVSAMEVDKFVHSHPDFLVLYAAGNDGEEGVYSVGEPATCKNCLAIGASQNAEKAYRTANYGISLHVDRPANCGGQLEFDATAAAFGPRIEGKAHGRMIEASPKEACSPLTGGDYTGRMVLIDRGTCSFVTKAKNAQDAGATAYVVANNKGQPPFSMGGGEGEDDIKIPGVMISRFAGKKLRSCDTPDAKNKTLGWVPATYTNAMGTWVGHEIKADGSSGECYQVVVGPANKIAVRSKAECMGNMNFTFASEGIFVTSSNDYTFDSIYAKNLLTHKTYPHTITSLGLSRRLDEKGVKKMEMVAISPECASDGWCNERHFRPPAFSAGKDRVFLSLKWVSDAHEFGNNTMIMVPNATTSAEMLKGFNGSLIFSAHELKFNDTNLAGFSSRGPTIDARMKPDIVAPGAMIFSAFSDARHYSHQCGTELGAPNSSITTMSGTSMATPTTAGLAALVRQYFVDGWYPSGAAQAGDKFNPSAALMKAVIMTSGQDLAGAVDVTGSGLFKAIPASPSFYQGYGRVQLDKVLRLSTTDPKSLWVSKVDPHLHRGEAHHMCVSVPADGSFKATLVWTDPPGNPASLFHVLVNDLDLTAVEQGTGKLYLGNNGLNGPESEGYFDTNNNNEQIKYTNSAGGTKEVSLSVSTALLGAGRDNQTYALAVHGDFTMVSESSRCGMATAPTCPSYNGNMCNGNPCVAGTCQCPPAHQGSPACAPACPHNCSYPLGVCTSDGLGNNNKRCICDKGAFGAACTMGSCGGLVTLNKASGHLSTTIMPPAADAGGAQQDTKTYAEDIECQWKIRVPDANKKVMLTFSKFATEKDYDPVTIYDGSEDTSPIITTLSGTLDQLNPIVSSGPEMYITFSSDQSKTAPGFIASFVETGCPGACSGHGACAATSGQCACESGWYGEDCSSLVACEASTSCSGHGQCDAAHSCVCDDGWTADNCGKKAECGALHELTTVPGYLSLSYFKDESYRGPCDYLIAPAAYKPGQLLYLGITYLVMQQFDYFVVMDGRNDTGTANTLLSVKYPSCIGFKGCEVTSDDTPYIVTSHTGQLYIKFHIDAVRRPASLWYFSTVWVITNGTNVPTAAPTPAQPTAQPTALPTAPTAQPTALPTATPSTAAPTAAPTDPLHPTAAPTGSPTSVPTPPTNAPTSSPTALPIPTNLPGKAVASSSVRLVSNWLTYDSVKDDMSHKRIQLTSWFISDITDFLKSHNINGITVKVINIRKGSVIIDFQMVSIGGGKTELQTATHALQVAIETQEIHQLAGADVDSTSYVCAGNGTCPTKIQECPVVVPQACPSCEAAKEEAEFVGEEKGALGTLVGVVMVIIIGFAVIGCYCLTKSNKEKTDISDIFKDKNEVSYSEQSDETGSLTPRTGVQIPL
jgi:hypothetical protein